jgi:hypothetical protein
MDLWTAVIALAVAGYGSVMAATPQGPCDNSLTQSIPARPAGAAGGRAFAEELRGLTDDERESRIQH